MVRIVKHWNKFSGKRIKSSSLMVFIRGLDKHLVGKTLFITDFVLG